MSVFSNHIRPFNDELKRKVFSEKCRVNMNERVKELVEQAGGCGNISKFHGHFLPPAPGYIDPATVDLEKFAELLIRECANLALNGKYDCEKFNATDDFHRGHNAALDFMAEGIRQHFGIE